MKLKDKALIKYFGQKNVDEALLNKFRNSVFFNFDRSPSIDMSEVVRLIQQFPSINAVNIIVGSNPEVINEALRVLPKSVSISLLDIDKNIFDEITMENGKKIRTAYFAKENRTVESIPIGEIAEKFPNLYSIDYGCRLQEGLNITDLEQITYLLEKTNKVSVSPELLAKYKEYLQKVPNEFSSRAIFGSQMIYDQKWFENFSKNSPQIAMYPGCELRKMTDFSELKEKAEQKTMIFCVNSMVDIPLEVAEKLKEQGINCQISFENYDNGNAQNAEYSLDEYVAMSRKMNELIGDIDNKLPDDQKFRQIYERVLKYLEYDNIAAYPKTKEEEEYAKKNTDDCRNLKNALLLGKCVCAGYADVLKNACLLKEIECEYIQGPVDSLEDKESYLLASKKEREKKTIVYSDEKDVIAREQHAWVKAKINGVWYNFDPTWDKDNIANHHVPKYAFLSDDYLMKLGRPTVGRLRHPCTQNIMGQEKSEIFKGLEPCSELIANNKVMEFESTVDEDGKPRQFPSIPKVFPWTKLLLNLQKFVKDQRRKTRSFVRDIRKKINPNFDKTEEMDIQPLPIPGANDKTKEIPQVTEEKKAPSWELSEEQLKAVKKVEQNGKTNPISEKEQSLEERE